MGSYNKKRWVRGMFLFLIIASIIIAYNSAPIKFGKNKNDMPISASGQIISDSGTLNPSPSPDPTYIAFYRAFEIRWLSGIPCSPPCWEGITPGETTMPQALELLTNNELISDVSVYEERDHGEINWKWATIGKGGGRLFYQPLGEGATVYTITPSLGTGMRLGDLIDFLGAPSHAIVKEQTEIVNSAPYTTWLYVIVWRDQGVMIRGGPLGDETKIDQNFGVTFVSLHEPPMKNILELYGPPGGIMLQWHGYDDYTGYLIP